MLVPFRRAITAPSARLAAPLCYTSAATRSTSNHVTVTRHFSSDSPIRRPKAVKIKKSEARRRVEPKAKETDALVEQQEYAQAPVEYQQNPFQPPQVPQTFGGMMKDSFFWGIGMAIAFTFVGLIFGRMEETAEGGAYDGSVVINSDTHTAKDQDEL